MPIEGLLSFLSFTSNVPNKNIKVKPLQIPSFSELHRYNEPITFSDPGRGGGGRRRRAPNPFDPYRSSATPKRDYFRLVNLKGAAFDAENRRWRGRLPERIRQLKKQWLSQQRGGVRSPLATRRILIARQSAGGSGSRTPDLEDPSLSTANLLAKIVEPPQSKEQIRAERRSDTAKYRVIFKNGRIQVGTFRRSDITKLKSSNVIHSATIVSSDTPDKLIMPVPKKRTTIYTAPGQEFPGKEAATNFLQDLINRFGLKSKISDRPTDPESSFFRRGFELPSSFVDWGARAKRKTERGIDITKPGIFPKGVHIEIPQPISPPGSSRTAPQIVDPVSVITGGSVITGSGPPGTGLRSKNDVLALINQFRAQNPQLFGEPFEVSIDFGSGTGPQIFIMTKAEIDFIRPSLGPGQTLTIIRDVAVPTSAANPTITPFEIAYPLQTRQLIKIGRDLTTMGQKNAQQDKSIQNLWTAHKTQQTHITEVNTRLSRQVTELGTSIGEQGGGGGDFLSGALLGGGISGILILLVVVFMFMRVGR